LCILQCQNFQKKTSKQKLRNRAKLIVEVGVVQYGMGHIVFSEVMKRKFKQ
jgi:hypothetical protein